MESARTWFKPKRKAELWERGAVRKVAGIRRGAISDNMRVSFQAARSVG
jgi:hypothetical protein